MSEHLPDLLRIVLQVVGTEQQGITGCVKGAKKTVRTIPCDKRHGSSLSQHSSETADSLPCFGPDSTDRPATQKQRDQRAAEQSQQSHNQIIASLVLLDSMESATSRFARKISGFRQRPPHKHARSSAQSAPAAVLTLATLSRKLCCRSIRVLTFTVV